MKILIDLPQDVRMALHEPPADVLTVEMAEINLSMLYTALLEVAGEVEQALEDCKHRQSKERKEDHTQGEMTHLD